MRSYIEAEKRVTMESGSPLQNHSMNQHKLKAALEGEKKAWGLSKKELKSLRRREKLQVLVYQNP
jgi:hypothetical protein